LNAVDSSVVIAAFASWHEAHEVARRVLDRGPRLVAHCALEVFSVLTRLPAPHRVPGKLVVAFLEDRFRQEPLTLSARDLWRLPGALQQRGVDGGAVYDGLVAMSAAAHGATLVTLDRRAEATYRRCGVRVRFLDGQPEA
jgi:predicted nucleic acid-binding protein